MRLSSAELFWRAVDRRSSQECWPWLLHLSRSGYGRATAHGKTMHAHRRSWELTNGPIPAGLYVLHHCDNRKCVNPAHLFLGTAADNIHDCAAKGRIAKGLRHGAYTKPETRRRGELSGSSKLTAEQVRRLHSLKGTGTVRAVAKQFGVSSSTVQDVWSGRTWWHLSAPSL